MALPPEIIKRLSDKVGQDVCTPEGAYFLTLDIETATHIKLGRNTVSRLVGLLSSNVSPRATTLNTIAIFLGYPNWGRLLENQPTIKEGFYPEKKLTYDMCKFPEGAIVDIRWNPNRRVLGKYIHGGIYKVLVSENGKLREGDIIYLSKLTIGLPFVVDCVKRGCEVISDIFICGGKWLGSYSAAAGSAVLGIEVNHEFSE